MADLTKPTIYKNNRFEILTDIGFKDFDGIIIGKNQNKIIIQLSKDGLKTKIVCTPKHKIFIDNEKWVYAKDLHINDCVRNDLKITSIKHANNNEKVYEILNVHDVHRYIINKELLCQQCLIIDEMAHIPEHIMSEFWNAVVPVVSSALTTKIFVVSTPNGTGNLFHQIYTQAERGELEQWHHERIDWHEIPGRGKKWKTAMEQALVAKGLSWAQEFNNEFIESGHSAVDGELINHFRNTCKPPTIVMMDGDYKIWKEPDPTHIYTIGVDVGEGIGQAASVAQIFDITDLAHIEQVAIYHNDKIDPFHFATVLNDLAHHWGRPWLLIERNNCGGTVIDTLTEVHEYHNVVDYTPENQAHYNKLGVYSHTNAKYVGVMNMRYWVNALQVVHLNDLATVHEIETFVKYPNGTWKKQKGDYTFDDRVMALVWALLILVPDICARYYEIVDYDANGKPKIIQPIHIEPPKYFKLDSFYQETGNAPLPAFIGMSPIDDDMEELYNQGWRIPGQ